MAALGATEGWNDAQKIQVAVRRLGSKVSDWHVRVGATHGGDWTAWSTAFNTAFAPKMTLQDWTAKMAACVQKPGESAIQYVVTKQRLLELAPVTLTDGQKVQALTEGLRDWKHQASIMQANPNNVAAFYTACNNLPASLSLAAATAATTVPAAAAVVASTSASTADAAAAVTDKLVSDLAARLERVFIGRSGGAAGGGAAYGGGRGRPVEPAGRGRGGGGAAAAPPPRPAGRFVPLAERECYNCSLKGHLAKHCPSPPKK